MEEEDLEGSEEAPMEEEHLVALREAGSYDGSEVATAPSETKETAKTPASRGMSLR